MDSQNENAVAQFRKEYGLSQDDLADLMGTSQATISNWESGKHPIPKYLILALEGLRPQKK